MGAMTTEQLATYRCIGPWEGSASVAWFVAERPPGAWPHKTGLASQAFSASEALLFAQFMRERYAVHIQISAFAPVENLPPLVGEIKLDEQPDYSLRSTVGEHHRALKVHGVKIR
jgi:hypothetical protein